MNNNNTPITNNPNELTTENSVLVLIDHQPWVAFAVYSNLPQADKRNIAECLKACVVFTGLQLYNLRTRGSIGCIFQAILLNE